MPAKIITVLNQKGGPGKTTVTMQLGGTLGHRGHRVLIIDADPQATATRWAASAPDDKEFPATVSGLAAAGEKVHREVKKYVEDYDVILVDCPPAVDSPVPQSALIIADLALVPVIPSPLDLWASVGIRKLIEAVQDLNESLQARVLVNQIQPNTTLAREVVEILPEYNIPLLTAQLRQRQAYRACALYGGTVHDIGSRAAPAIAEVDALTDEVSALIGLNGRRKNRRAS